MKIRIDVRDIPKVNSGYVDVFIQGIEQILRIGISHQVTGFGVKQLLICPKCRSRREYLYLTGDKVVCRVCLPKYESPYVILKNSTKGGYLYITYMMKRIAKKYGISIKFPFEYYQLLLEKPKYMHNSTWEKIARKLQVLESFRRQSITCHTSYYNSRIYDVKDIKYALDNCLYVFEIFELLEHAYTINWRDIVEEFRKLENKLRGNKSL